jgi:tetratricopeptide (TPR) repeat protein/predicted Ser/Thr protein kinase
MLVAPLPPMTASDPPADADASRDGRLQRLGDAMAAFQRFRAAGQQADRAAFLREHAHLHDVLAPLFETMADTAAGAASAPAPATDAGSADGGAPTLLGPGTCLGDYRLVREVGRGGMGVVYEAEQLSLGRRVALKVLPAHLTGTARSIERFRREAAAASRLRHPAIVPIHDVGEWRGVHWFSMEFVDGRPLHEVMQQERLGVRDDCSRVAELAEITARLADALQHAHDRGLVHRDVKPHNVMIGADGSVRLLDFGLAKETDAVSQSATGEFLGTPHYCSPEQITGRGQAGPAADVFSLGIVLYELLARQRPFDGDSARAVLSRIEAGEFPPLQKTAPDVPRDLQTICHKALERRPQDRYPSAGAFAADLRRFLRIEPIHAVPPGMVTRASKWLRRHRLRVGFAAALAVATLGAPLAWALHLHATRATVLRERQVLAAAEELGFRGIEQCLALLTDRLDQKPGHDASDEADIDAVIGLCESYLQLRGDDPRRRHRVAVALWSVAGIHSRLGNTSAGLAACQRAREVLQDEAGNPGDALLLARLAQRELHLRQLAEPTAGEREFLAAQTAWRQLMDAPANPAPAAATLGLAETLVVRARALADRPDRRLDAESLLQEARTILADRCFADHTAAQELAVGCDAVLGHVLLALGRNQPALDLLQEVVGRIDGLPGKPPLAVEKTNAQVAIGNALQRLQRSDEAQQVLRDAIAAGTIQLQQFPGSRALRRALLSSRTILGSVLMVNGKFAESEAVLREAEVALAAVPPPAGTADWIQRSLEADLAIQLANGLLLQDQTDLAGAETRLLHAIALLQALVGEHPNHVEFRIELGAAWNSLASLGNEHGDHERAASCAEQAIEAQTGALAVLPQHGKARTFLGIHYGQLACAESRRGRDEAASRAATLALQYAGRQPATLRLAAEAATLAMQTAQDHKATAADADAASAAAARAEAHGALAVRLLSRLGELDRREARRLLADRRFTSLRTRPDLEQLAQRLDRP